jgi:phage terminase large subunit-like protein
MHRTATTAAAVPFCYQPHLPGMAIYADGVPMTDRLLGLMALAIGGALAWFLFEPVMSATAAHGVNADTLLTVVVLLLGVLVGWAVVDRLRR